MFTHNTCGAMFHYVIGTPSAWHSVQFYTLDFDSRCFKLFFLWSAHTRKRVLSLVPQVDLARIDSYVYSTQYMFYILTRIQSGPIPAGCIHHPCIFSGAQTTFILIRLASCSLLFRSTRLFSNELQKRSVPHCYPFLHI